MKLRKRHQETTRRAILGALAEVIAESGATDFSVQAVADRAEVTHRTVYNHFPTRQALNDGLAVFVEDELARTIGGEFPDADLSLDAMRKIPDKAFPMFDSVEAQSRAYVMLMIASRAPASLHRERSARMEEAIEHQAGPLPDGTAKMVTAALRMIAVLGRGGG